MEMNTRVPAFYRPIWIIDLSNYIREPAEDTEVHIDKFKVIYLYIFKLFTEINKV